MTYDEIIDQRNEFNYIGRLIKTGLNTLDEIKSFFKFSDEDNTVYLDHARYELENTERIDQGKEWVG